VAVLHVQPLCAGHFDSCCCVDFDTAGDVVMTSRGVLKPRAFYFAACTSLLESVVTRHCIAKDFCCSTCQSPSAMQCADLLDKHVGSIAELPKQSDIAVVPPGLRCVMIATFSTFSTICCVAEVISAILNSNTSPETSHHIFEPLFTSTDGISGSHPEHPTCQLLSTSCQRQQSGERAQCLCLLCCAGVTAASGSFTALHIQSNALSATH
jgi:hypothetical protein